MEMEFYVHELCISIYVCMYVCRRFHSFSVSFHPSFSSGTSCLLFRNKSKYYKWNPVNDEIRCEIAHINTDTCAHLRASMSSFSSYTPNLIVNQIFDAKMRNVVVSVLVQYAYLNVKQISNLNCSGFVLVMAFEFQNQLGMLSLHNMSSSRYSCSNHFQHNRLNLLLFSIVSVFFSEQQRPIKQSTEIHF